MDEIFGVLSSEDDDLFYSMKIVYQDGEPCDHPGCMNHFTHPCERCHRIMCKGIVYKFNEFIL